jgi:hypothetical protein
MYYTPAVGFTVSIRIVCTNVRYNNDVRSTYEYEYRYGRTHRAPVNKIKIVCALYSIFFIFSSFRQYVHSKYSSSPRFSTHTFCSHGSRSRTEQRPKQFKMTAVSATVKFIVAVMVGAALVATRFSSSEVRTDSIVWRSNEQITTCYYRSAHESTIHLM